MQNLPGHFALRVLICAIILPSSWNTCNLRSLCWYFHFQRILQWLLHSKQGTDCWHEVLVCQELFHRVHQEPNCIQDFLPCSSRPCNAYYSPLQHELCWNPTSLPWQELVLTVLVLLWQIANFNINASKTNSKFSLCPATKANGQASWPKYQVCLVDWVWTSVLGLMMPSHQHEPYLLKWLAFSNALAAHWFLLFWSIQHFQSSDFWQFQLVCLYKRK